MRKRVGCMSAINESPDQLRILQACD